MEFIYEKLTKKEKNQYDKLTENGKKLYEKQWCKITEEINKLQETINRDKEREEKQRRHRLIQVGASVESVLQEKLETKEDLEKLMNWLRKNDVKNFRNVQ